LRPSIDKKFRLDWPIVVCGPMQRSHSIGLRFIHIDLSLD
jgi:hypothetical protein